ncbi:hypothetical protein D9757_004629 [Collybiopsis confluens]|uniref:HORMA domain-containing protein n=1 Tax=Collybiopsis confluens TaxID=2823264 RepID=A0A8H5MCC4_9AGAR|nr:hypothetical protein D9757_004629 [Collybiopsis confluens]
MATTTETATPGPSLTFNQTARGITDFIEVAIHTILYVRQIYPAELFIRRKKYDAPVFQSRHPTLNAYIGGAVQAVREELLKGNLDKMIVVIKNKDEEALERFIFSVENMIQVEKFDKDTRSSALVIIQRTEIDRRSLSVEGAMSSLSLGQYFRSFLVKLNMIEAQLGQMYLGGTCTYSKLYGQRLSPADEVSFAIIIELKDGLKPSTIEGSNEPPPWIPADKQHTTTGASEDAELHTVRSVSTGIINLSLVVQESDVKLSLSSDVPVATTDKGKSKAP